MGPRIRILAWLLALGGCSGDETARGSGGDTGPHTVRDSRPADVPARRDAARPDTADGADTASPDTGKADAAVDAAGPDASNDAAQDVAADAAVDAAATDATSDTAVPDAGNDAAGADAAQPPCPDDADCAYLWSANAAIEPAVVGRQRCETALTTDAQGVVWLSYLDTDYHETRPDFWVAWPREVVVWSSDDLGRTFGHRRTLTAVDAPEEAEGDEALASDALGNVYAAWVQYDHEAGLVQRIAFQRIAGPGEPSPPATDILPFDGGTRHDQASLHVDADGTVHLLGRDIGTYPPGEAPRRLLYANSDDQGGSFAHAQRLPDLGGSLPQLVATQAGLIAAGPGAFVVSPDNGVSFGPRRARFFAHPPGGKQVRLAAGPDRRVAYVVADSVNQGVQVHSTDDGGETWRVSRADDGQPATSWRYPVVHVDAGNRVHVVWIDDRTGHGAVYHAYSDDDGEAFSADTRVSDVDFPFPADAPPPPPATQDGSWIGDYNAITTVQGAVVVAWADQRAGNPATTVYVAVGRFRPR